MANSTPNRYPRPRDIHTLIRYTNCSRELAIHALKHHPKLHDAFKYIGAYENYLALKMFNHCIQPQLENGTDSELLQEH